jgi:hypothetical protein
MHFFPRAFLSCALFLLTQNTLAWDSVGHRLSASVTAHFIDASTKTVLLNILQQHPRYQQDFVEQMPTSVARSNAEQRFGWLLGQAAFWPDIARGLPKPERNKYNHPTWHYIDGAWLRDSATIQGNSYIGVQPLDEVIGKSTRAMLREHQVDNLILALDYNTAILANKQSSPEQRAISLCWVLHLIGDVHQPLHVGSLYSAHIFRNGDRGGNGIVTDKGNLHSRWDRALCSDGINLSLKIILEDSTLTDRVTLQEDADWSLWMNESRQILLDSVYTQEMKTAIASSDRSGEKLPQFTLTRNYIMQMQETARQQLALAGHRLALWLTNNLD